MILYMRWTEEFNFLQDVRKFPGKIFCQKFPGSAAAGAAGHFPALIFTYRGEYNKIEIYKMASRFGEVTDKEISEFKINSVPKNTNTKTIVRLKLGDYRAIFTSTSSRWIFPDNHLAFGE
jgi:hypothetical protein